MKKANFTFTNISSVENFRSQEIDRIKRLAFSSEKDRLIANANKLYDEIIAKIKKDGYCKVFKKNSYIELINN